MFQIKWKIIWQSGCFRNKSKTLNLISGPLSIGFLSNFPLSHVSENLEILIQKGDRWAGLNIESSTVVVRPIHRISREMSCKQVKLVKKFTIRILGWDGRDLRGKPSRGSSLSATKFFRTHKNKTILSKSFIRASAVVCRVRPISTFSWNFFPHWIFQFRTKGS